MKLAVPGMRLDFGGIGKGFAADQVLKLLKNKFGIRSALVAAAGDITVSDSPPGQAGWAIDIAPLRKEQPRRRLILANASVSTSGDLEQVAVIDGVRYSHIVNPKTGLGLTGRRSATVIAPHGSVADSLTKLACVLPEAEALKKLKSWSGVAASITVQLDDAMPERTVQTKNFASFLAKPL
jgi:FAD:protein FMN transferase